MGQPGKRKGSKQKKKPAKKARNSAAQQQGKGPNQGEQSKQTAAETGPATSNAQEQPSGPTQSTSSAEQAPPAAASSSAGASKAGHRSEAAAGQPEAQPSPSNTSAASTSKSGAASPSEPAQKPHTATANAPATAKSPGSRATSPYGKQAGGGAERSDDETSDKKGRRRKGPVREWIDAILFAAIVALIIRTFLLEAFVIPTSSMERTLMVGDFLFVSKVNYGPRLPMVPLSVPFVHNRLPMTHTKSYLDWIVLPYMRIPGFEDVERNDIVVFNYPADDVQPNDPKLGPVAIPSMKENFIKRCVAQAGDTIAIRRGLVYIDGQKAEQPDQMSLRYRVEFQQGEGLNPVVMKRYDLRPNPRKNANVRRIRPNVYQIDMDRQLASTFRGFANVRSVERVVTPRGQTQSRQAAYPHDTAAYPWNVDFWGPAWVPKEGATIKLTPRNVDLYSRVIRAYEDHELKVKLSTGEILIDGEVRTEYTFEMDYYFMVGDNRYNSHDSRFWGFVPVSHIVGKPLFVLFNSEDGFGWRWERAFMGIN